VPALQRGTDSRFWKRILSAVLVGAIVAFALLNRSMVSEAAGILRDANLRYVAVAAVFSLLSVVNRGEMFRFAHRAVGLETGRRDMANVAAAAYALNKVAKTAGAGGVALFVRAGALRAHAAGTVAAAYMVGSVSAQIGLGVILAIACVSAVVTGAISSTWLGTVLGFIAYLILMMLVVLVASRSRERLQWLYDRGARIVSGVARRFGRRGPNGEGAVIDDFYDAVHSIRRRPASFWAAVGHASLDKMIGAMVLANALAAVGADISFASVLQAFAVALVAAMVAFVPGGLGAVEASMVAVLVSQGLDLPTAGAAVVIFRLIDLWVPLIIGTLAARTLVASSAARPLGQAPSPSPDPTDCEHLPTQSLPAQNPPAQTLQEALALVPLHTEEPANL